MKNVWIWIETKDGAPLKACLELFSSAKALGGTTTAVVLGGDKDEWSKTLGAYGAERVLVLNGADETAWDSELVTAVFAEAVAAFQPAVVLAAADERGREVLPRVAARVNGTYTANAMQLGVNGEKITCTYPAYGGGVLVDAELNGEGMKFLTVRPGAFRAPEAAEGAAAQAEEFAPAVDPACLKVKVLETVCEITEMVALEDAEVIVAGGRGMGTADDFRLVEELAELLHGAVGATRPAIEDGWVSKAHQVGQSGKIVTPKLYIACGISGATQHVSAIMDSGFIVAINKDEEAPIFELADIGIVGDVREILPLMIEAVKARNA